MSNLSPSDIQALLDAGRIVEAGSLLTMHGEALQPEERQALERKRQLLWSQAKALVAEAEILEQEGKNTEAQDRYLQAAGIASDFPGIQDHCKRMREALTLASAVRHRSARIKAQAKHASRRGSGKSTAGLLVTALLLLGIGGGGAWWALENMGRPSKARLPEATTASPPDASAGVPVPTVTASPQNDKPISRPIETTDSMPPGTQEMSATTSRPSLPIAEPEPPSAVITDQPVAQADPAIIAPLPPVQETAAVSPRQDLAKPEPVVDRSTADASFAKMPDSAPPAQASKTPTRPPEVVLSDQAVPAEKPPLPRQGQSVETVYTVQPGDTLSEIASRLFCTQEAWHQIHALNRDRVNNPKLLRPGVQLRTDGIKSRCQPQP